MSYRVSQTYFSLPSPPLPSPPLPSPPLPSPPLPSPAERPRSTPTTTAPLRIQSVATTALPLPLPPITVNTHHWQHHPPTSFPPHCSETHSLHLPRLMLHSKGRIVHPQFVEFVIHPEVDPYKDIPKLPGQCDPSFSPPPHIGWISCEDMDRGKSTYNF